MQNLFMIQFSRLIIINIQQKTLNILFRTWIILVINYILDKLALILIFFTLDNKRYIKNNKDQVQGNQKFCKKYIMRYLKTPFIKNIRKNKSINNHISIFNLFLNIKLIIALFYISLKIFPFCKIFLTVFSYMYI